MRRDCSKFNICQLRIRRLNDDISLLSIFFFSFLCSHVPLLVPSLQCRSQKCSPSAHSGVYIAFVQSHDGRHAIVRPRIDSIALSKGEKNGKYFSLFNLTMLLTGLVFGWSRNNFPFTRNIRTVHSTTACKCFGMGRHAECCEENRGKSLTAGVGSDVLHSRWWSKRHAQVRIKWGGGRGGVRMIRTL